MEVYWPSCVKPQWILHITLSYGKAAFMDFCFISKSKKCFLNPLLFYFFSDQCGLFTNSYCKHLSIFSGLRDFKVFLILKRPRSWDHLHRSSHKSAPQGAESVQLKMLLQTPSKGTFHCCHPTPPIYYLTAVSAFVHCNLLFFMH